MCSEYEKRHPENRSKTAGQIIKDTEEKDGCWPRDMASIILTVVQGLSSDLEENMRGAGINILKIFMFLWILYASFMAVVFPSKGASFLKDFMTRFFCMIVAVMILSSGDSLKSFYKYTLSPIISLGIGLSQEINDHIDSSALVFAREVRNRVGTAGMGEDYCNVSTSGYSGTGTVQCRNGNGGTERASGKEWTVCFFVAGMGRKVCGGDYQQR